MKIASRRFHRIDRAQFREPSARKPSVAGYKRVRTFQRMRSDEEIWDDGKSGFLRLGERGRRANHL